MRIVFYVSDKAREINLAEAFSAGAAVYGLKVELRGLDEPVACDVACMVGVKSRRLWKEMERLGATPVLFDKGYSRHRLKGCWEYWRISYGAHNPTATTLLKMAYPRDRFDALNLEVKPWRTDGDCVLIAGSSGKYHHFHNLEDPNVYTRKLVRKIRKQTDKEIIYRPKPSWREARSIPGTTYSWPKEPLAAVLDRCSVVVSHGSNICFEAAIAGIPNIILGDGVMKPISSTSIVDIEEPKLLNRQAIFNSLAYHQWTLAELRSGEAFNIIGSWL